MNLPSINPYPSDMLGYVINSPVDKDSRQNFFYLFEGTREQFWTAKTGEDLNFQRRKTHWIRFVFTQCFP